MSTPEEAATALEAFNDELADRQIDINEADDYYRGEHNLRYGSEDFNRFFSEQYKGFADNWVQVVADAPAERLEVVGFRPADATPADTDMLWRIWMESEADAESDMAFLDTILSKRTHIMVWKNPGAQMPTITFEHPSQSIVGYHPGTRRRKAAAKVWSDDRLTYGTVIYPDRVYKFQRPNDTGGLARNQLWQFTGGWKPRETGEPWIMPNPMGEVAMVEMANRPRLVGEPMSDVAGVIPMQDAINLLWAYLFNAADAQSIAGRVVMGQERPTRPVLDSDGNDTGERVEIDLDVFKTGRMTWLDDPNAKIGQWDAADLNLFTSTIQRMVGHIASQTRTPHHYFTSGTSISNISADAMRALETGLVQRTREKTQANGRAIREAGALAAIALEDQGLADRMRRGAVLFADIETRSEAQHTDALQKKADIGYPFEYLLELDGKGPEEIDRIMGMRRTEQAGMMADVVDGLFDGSE